MIKVNPHFSGQYRDIVENITIKDRTFPHSFFPIAVFFVDKNEANILIMNIWNDKDIFEHTFSVCIDKTDEVKQIKFNETMFDSDMIFINIKTSNDLQKLTSQHDYPKHIYSSYEEYDVPTKKYKSIMFTRLINSNYEHHFFNNNNRRNMIRDNFDKNVLEAYDMLLPGAYRADMWRLCCLYLNGGVYMDDKMISLYNLDKILNKYSSDCLMVEDLPHNCKDGIANAFIVSKPNSIFIKTCIDSIITNVFNKHYGDNALSITGPCALGHVFGNMNKDVYMAFRLVIVNSHDNDDFLICDRSDVPVVCTSKNYQNLKTDSYVDSWVHKTVYAKENFNCDATNYDFTYIMIILLFILLFISVTIIVM